MKRIPQITLLVSLLAVGAQGQQPVPLGDEFQVNTFTTGSQLLPSVAVDPVSGNFVVVWFGNGVSDPYYGILAQRYASDGSALGSELQVNSYTSGRQSRPAVAVDLLGNFVVAWSSIGSAGTDTDFYSIQGRRFSVDGSAIGEDFQINTYTTGAQRTPAVAVDADGDFVVVWGSDGSGGDDSDGTSVQGQRFTSDGAPVGSEFQINTYTTGFQGSLDRRQMVAVDPDGNFVVVWGSSRSAGPDLSESIQGQRYDASGIRLGGEFQINTYATSSQLSPSVAVEPDGDFVVVWRSGIFLPGPDGDYGSIAARRYTASGEPVGEEFQVNSYTTDYQILPSVAKSPDGGFVVVWESFGSSGTDTSESSVQGQVYDSDGSPVGEEFQVTPTPRAANLPIRRLRWG